MKKRLIVVLLLSILAGTFVGCSDNSDDIGLKETTNDNVVASIENEEVLEEKTTLLADSFKTKNTCSIDECISWIDEVSESNETTSITVVLSETETEGIENELAHEIIEFLSLTEEVRKPNDTLLVKIAIPETGTNDRDNRIRSIDECISGRDEVLESNETTLVEVVVPETGTNDLESKLTHSIQNSLAWADDVRKANY